MNVLRAFRDKRRGGQTALAFLAVLSLPACHAASQTTSSDTTSILDSVFESKETRYKREQAARDAQEKLEEERRWRAALEEQRRSQREARERKRVVNAPVRVWLFTGSDCAECREVAQLLTNLGVPFTRKTVDRDSQAKRELEDIWRKNPSQPKALPVTQIGRSLVYGFDEGKMVAALKAHITPTISAKPENARGTSLPPSAQKERERDIKAEAEKFETLEARAKGTQQFPKDVNGAVTPPTAQLPK